MSLLMQKDFTLEPRHDFELQGMIWHSPLGEDMDILRLLLCPPSYDVS